MAKAAEKSISVKMQCNKCNCGVEKKSKLHLLNY